MKPVKKKKNKLAIRNFSDFPKLSTERPRDKISGLPFTEQGYVKAKEVFKTKDRGTFLTCQS